MTSVISFWILLPKTERRLYLTTSRTLTNKVLLRHPLRQSHHDAMLN